MIDTQKDFNDSRDSISPEERLLAILAHAISIFAGFVPALIIYLIAKPEQVYLKENAKESLNFQITVAIALFVSFLLAFLIIGIVLLPVVGVLNLIFCILGSVEASNLGIYRYPVSLRFIK